MDKIGVHIPAGDVAGKFAPHVPVWGEMAVRVAVLRALQSAQQCVHPTGLNVRQKDDVRQMIQSALDTGSA